MGKQVTISTYITSCSESETIELGRKIGSFLVPGDRIYLCGDLGTGKTRIAKGLINAATNTPLDEINSPTFTLMNRYQGDPVVYHADLYRIENDDLEEVGIEMVEESQGVLVVEWAEKIALPSEDCLRIDLEHTDDENVRIITLEWNVTSSWSSRLCGRLPSGNQDSASGCKSRTQNYLCYGESLCRS